VLNHQHSFRSLTAEAQRLLQLKRSRRRLRASAGPLTPTGTTSVAGMVDTLAPLSHIDKYRGTMRLGQECIDFVSLPIECQRVCARFRRHHLLAAHCANIDNVN
jgi:hypothetical protein